MSLTWQKLKREYSDPSSKPWPRLVRWASPRTSLDIWSFRVFGNDLDWVEIRDGHRGASNFKVRGGGTNPLDSVYIRELWSPILNMGPSLYDDFDETNNYILLAAIPPYLE